MAVNFRSMYTKVIITFFAKVITLNKETAEIQICIATLTLTLAGRFRKHVLEEER